MTDHGPELLRSDLSGVAEVYLMMQPRVGNVGDKTLAFYEIMHLPHRRGFIVVRADMHALDAQSLVICKELRL